MSGLSTFTLWWICVYKFLYLGKLKGAPKNIWNSRAKTTTMVFNGFFVAWFGKNIFLSFTLSWLGWLTLLTWGLRSRQNNPSRQQTLLLLQLQQLPARSFQVRKHQSFQARPFASFFETWSSACHFFVQLVADQVKDQLRVACAPVCFALENLPVSSAAWIVPRLRFVLECNHFVLDCNHLSISAAYFPSL